MSDLLFNFYTTPRLSSDSRMSVARMTDQGGAFGLDIHHALEIDYLIHRYDVDAIIETGTHVGDTTEYLSKQYSHLPIITCDINDQYLAVARNRLSGRTNVSVLNESGEQVVRDYGSRYRQPLFFLDAHWEEYWPLRDELSNIQRGVVAVDDCKIHDESYYYDVYDGQCADYTWAVNASTPTYYNNPEGTYPYPSMQMTRRAGRMYYCVDIKEDHFKDTNVFYRSLQ